MPPFCCLLHSNSNLVVFCRMGIILHAPCSGGSHSHGLNHNHSSEKQGNINVRAAVIHVLGDFIQSIGVLVAAIIIKLNVSVQY